MLIDTIYEVLSKELWLKHPVAKKQNKILIRLGTQKPIELLFDEQNLVTHVTIDQHDSEGYVHGRSYNIPRIVESTQKIYETKVAKIKERSEVKAGWKELKELINDDITYVIIRKLYRKPGHLKSNGFYCIDFYYKTLNYHILRAMLDSVLQAQMPAISFLITSDYNGEFGISIRLAKVDTLETIIKTLDAGKFETMSVQFKCGNLSLEEFKAIIKPLAMLDALDLIV